MMGVSRISGLDKMDTIEILAFTPRIQAVGKIHEMSIFSPDKHKNLN